MEPMTVIFWNCASGLKSKYDFIKHHLNESQACLAFISEAELQPQDLSVVQVPGYDLLVSRTIDKGKARIAAYIKTTFKYKQIDISDSDLDIICLDILGARYIGLYKGFKLPKGITKINYFRSLIDSLTFLTSSNKRVLVGGDFNVDLFTKSSNLNELDIWSLNAGLQQLVTSFTRRRLVDMGNGVTRLEQSAIDHIYTNDGFTLTQSPSISDHDILTVTKPKHDQLAKIRKKFTVRDWRKYTKLAATVEMDKQISQFNDMSETQFVLALKTTLDKVAPLRVIRVTDDQIINPKVEAIKKRRDRYFKKF